MNFLKGLRPFEEKSKRVWLNCYPYDSFAFTQVVFQVMINYDKVINTFGLEVRKILGFIEKHAVTNINCTPTFISMLMYSKQSKYKSVKSITTGGKTISKRVIKR